MKHTFVGLNIQYPISKLIIERTKTIETRTYPMPEKYIGQQLLMIETPGPTGNFRARVVAKIVFGESFQYPNRTAFYKDQVHHLVTTESPWKWKNEKPKWGWPIEFLELVEPPFIVLKRKGIVFTKGIELPI